VNKIYWIRFDKESLRVSFNHSGERIVELLCTSRLQNLKLYSQEWGRLLLCLQDRFRTETHTEHGNPGSAGDHFLEKLELFGTYFHIHRAQPCDVPTRSCEAFNEPRTNGIARQYENDGDRARRASGRLGCLGRRRDENVDPEAQ